MEYSNSNPDSNSDDELQELPHTRARVKMAKGKGVQICLGLLFSCCLLSCGLFVALALLLRMAEEPLIDAQVKQVLRNVMQCRRRRKD